MSTKPEAGDSPWQFPAVPIKVVKLSAAKRRDNLQRSKCKAVHRQHGANGDDFSCGYDTTINCDDCKYAQYPGRKDPAAKCNQPQGVTKCHTRKNNN